MAGALIITAELAQGDFSWIEGLRRAHYPPDRNQVRAHLTMFHALPPSSEGEVRSRLAQIVRRPAPGAMIAGLMDLEGGVAFRVVSPELDRIRDLRTICTGFWVLRTTVVGGRISLSRTRSLRKSREH